MGSLRHRLLVIALALPLLAGCGGGRLTVHLPDRDVTVADGTTLAKLGVHAPAGNLLAVDGTVLHAGVYAGKVELDGKIAAASTKLHDGDTVSVVRGKDRRERTVKIVSRVPGGEYADPQFFLIHTPGRQVEIRGAVSRKLVSVTFLPAGKATRERAVALTFDDGPSPTYTPRILDTLKRLHVKATFFVIGYLADEYPSIVRREKRLGMTVGNHSYNHPSVPAFDQLPSKLLDDEIALGAASLGHAGVTPTLFRPPEGSFSNSVVKAAQAHGERVVLWSVDPRDWAGIGTAEIVRNVLSSVRPGSIVILHDGGGDRSATLDALPAIVKGIKQRGLRLEAVGS
ncbi:MAG TPA: polysaccharide deacetylase family protein [Gaiellaceae bacterium]|nr:polysaccharide deacetylase family protein [Gaiellaceae bacterium]